MEMSDGGNVVVEERRENKGGEGSPRLKIGRHDKLHAEIPVLSFRNLCTCFHKSIFLLLLPVRCLASYCTPVFWDHRSSLESLQSLPGQSKSSHHIANWHYKGPSLGHLPHLLPTSRKSTCDKSSITNNLYLPIYTPRCNIRLSLFLPSLPCNFHSIPSYTTYALPPQYTLYSHISSPNIGTLPLLPNTTKAPSQPPQPPTTPHPPSHSPQRSSPWYSPRCPPPSWWYSVFRSPTSSSRSSSSHSHSSSSSCSEFP
jgi:hypothetical protein